MEYFFGSTNSGELACLSCRGGSGVDEWWGRLRRPGSSWTLARHPPAKERGKGRVQQPDIEAYNDYTAYNSCPSCYRLIYQDTHDITPTRKIDQGDHRQRQDEAQHDLADHQGAGRI